MFLLPVACIILSIPGWLKFGIHLNAAFMSITGLLGVLVTLGAIAIAFGIKRIPWRTPLRILIASYWFSFGVGRGAMAIHPSAYQAVDRLFRAPHVPAVHQ